MCGNTRGAATFCCVYSLLGLLFMSMVILMLTYQPFFVGGIDDRDHAKTNAYGAMFSFAFVFLVSVFCLIQDTSTRGGRSQSDDEGFGGMNGRRRRGDGAHEYDGIPSGRTSDGPAVLQNYALNLDLPESVQEGVFS